MSELTAQEAEELASFPASLTLDQVEEIEKAWQRDTGINRRTLLLMLSKDGEGLQEFAIDNPDTVFEVFECGVTYLNKVRDFEELMSAACHRLMISLCVLDWDAGDVPFGRDQMDEICSRLARKDEEVKS